MRICFILLVQFSLINVASGQWSKVVLRTDAAVTEEITDAFFFNSDTGFVSTAKGVLYKTTDGGTNWTYDTVSPNNSIYHFDFPTRDTGYMTTEGGHLYKSINGGNSWFNIANNTGAIHGFHFMSGDIGTIGSVYGISRTTNGGQTWNPVPIDNGGNGIRDLYFLNDTLGFIFHPCSFFYPDEDGTISITKDGGLTWQEQNNICARLFLIFKNYYGYLVSDSVFLGFSWGGRLVRGNIDATNIHYPFPGDSLAAYDNSGFLPPEGYPHNIRFYNGQIGMAAYWNKIIKTEDAGETWTVTDFDYTNDYDTTRCTEPALEFLFPITTDKWIVMGGCGRIYITENRGGTWSGIKDEGKENKVMLYPNPATNQLIITTTTATRNATVTITTPTGSTVMQMNLANERQNEVDVNKLSAGLYFLCLQDEKGRMVRRFVKE